ADGLLVVTPYYNKATQQGLYEHFKTIANSVTIPIILYNVPSRTGMNITAQTAARLFHDVENIVGMKEASGNMSQAAELMHLTNGAIDLYSGNDDMVVPLLSLGGSGVISVASNVAPKYMHDMVFDFIEGKIVEATKMQIDLIPLCKALFCEVNPIPVKAAMAMKGFKVGEPRLPLTVMEEAHQKILLEEMKNMQLL
ncbi:MAG TPA: 4-hydroxy-tetrahydrodipicolinate synthase, partial [Candidatus Dorea intestinavium]|nr:4-hydroxy-tetrahydrodipicolinate synthase [Candidatus Dorea intestinavium]